MQWIDWKVIVKLGKTNKTISYSTLREKHAKFNLDPPNRLATVHERHRQTGQDRQTDRQTTDG